ncbi:MAG TPA: VOC family protein [Euzebyales bacterium]|nr:VOC family protein [Euzebyales bacterium]
MPLPDRWFRAQPDSSALPAPRLLARHFVHPDDLDAQIAFHERALGVPCDSRTPIPDAGLELATVGNLLLIANPRPPGEVARATAYTLLVASVAGHVAGLEDAGVEVTEPVATAASGSRARVRHPDGTLVEIIDFRPLPEERTAG